MTNVIPLHVEPWERTDDESDPAWAAFAVYRELEPKDRSQTEVARRLGKSKQLIARWAVRYSWTIRATAYDRHRDHQWFEQTLHLRREIAERDIRVSGVMIGKVAQRLQTLNPEALSARDCAAWVKIAADLSRLAIGEPTQRLEHTGPGGAPLVDPAQLTPEERRARLRQLTNEATRRLGETG